MKKITLISVICFASLGLTACGGGKSNASVDTNTPAVSTNTPTTPSTNSSHSELIIDNGRGVTNNQDTERVK